MSDAAPAPAGTDVGLGDVLLAMDVVDTLRHEQRVVSEALGAEAREQALIERVRRAYAAQGLEVSDTLIAEGVAKLKERQFDYEPPAPGFKTGLAKLWINRARIGTGIAAVAILAAIVGGGWYGFVELPAARKQAALVASTDTGIADAARDLARLNARSKAVAESVAAERDTTTPREAGAAVGAELDAADAAVAAATAALTQAASLTQVARNDNPDDVGRAEARSERLQEQRGLLATASRELGSADRALAGLGALRALPGTIATLRDEALGVAATDNAKARSAVAADTALSALQRGEAAAAREGVTALRDLLAMLQTETRLRIVSRPGVMSGVIRSPNSNRRVQNFYLVIEAIDADGAVVPMAVTSEEDGTTKTVPYWAVRVSEATFERVRRDKADDGIIQNDAAGAKPRGHLEIEWTLPNEGGAIHTWENRR